MNHLPTEILQKIAKSTLSPRKFASILKFRLTTSDERVYRIWDLFFKDYEWLQLAQAAQNPPYLLGSGLKKLFGGEIDPSEPAYLSLVCPCFGKFEQLKKSLRPYHKHEHGRGRSWSYEVGFEDHNITLNLRDIFFPKHHNTGIDSTCPDQLTDVISGRRVSTSLLYGEKDIEQCQVYGLGESAIFADSVKRICEIQVKGQSFIFSKDPLWLYQRIAGSYGWEYGEHYNQRFKLYIMKRFESELERGCIACRKKGAIPPDII